MTIVLCSDCGKVMKRYTTKCDRCTRTKLEFFRSPDSERLNQRIKQITGRAPHNVSPMLSSLLVIAVAIAITAVTQGLKNHSFNFIIPSTLQAAAPSTVPH